MPLQTRILRIPKAFASNPARRSGHYSALMPLSVIKGPPNSGRTEQVRREYVELLPHRPILVVPGADDVSDWRRRLTRESGAFLGASIVTFKELVRREILGDSSTGPRVVAGLRRRHRVESALIGAWPEMRSRIASQPGLVDAMEELIDELRQAMISPGEFEARVAETGSGYLSSIAAVYRRYDDDLARAGETDAPALAQRALETDLTGFQGRPVYLAGFDDLTPQQLELVVRLSTQTDVTVALTHEVGNPSMVIPEGLLGRLTAAGATVRKETHRDRDLAPTHDPLLLDLEREFMRQEVPGSLPPGDAVTVMRSSGARGEAEAVASRIAALVSNQVDPGQIAIAVNSPASNGGRFRDLLDEYSVPSTLESETSAESTAVGRAVLDLIAASGRSGTAADLLRFLRGPVGVDPEAVDRAEYRIVRAGTESAAAAARFVEEELGSGAGTEALPEVWSTLTTDPKGEPMVESIRGFCSELSRAVLDADPSPIASPLTVTEAQTANAISQACAELLALDEDLEADAIASAIGSGAIKIWSPPTIGSVRIASPYSLRAKRFEHLFIVSLQESAFTGDRGGPFLSAQARNDVGLPDFADPEDQELYLFYSCLTVPTRGLWLSCRIADESGKAEHPSPLVAAVEDLFPAGSIRAHGRSAEEIAFRVGEAPNRTELARSLATKLDPIAALGSPELALDPVDIDSIAARLTRATEAEASTRTLESLTLERSLELLGESRTFSATALEAFTSCPYKWFIERALRPQRFGPEPEPIARGQLVHAVLAGLYGERLGQIPRPDTVEEWIAEVEPAVRTAAEDPEIRLDSDSAAHRVIRRQAVNTITTYLRSEAARESPGFLPRQTEADFGMDEEPLDMGDWKLRGSIDRIDVSGEEGVGLGQRGIVIDYKTGSSGVLSRVDIERQRKLQLQLYMHAIRARWGIEPAAGFYVPVHRGAKGPRGIVDAHSAGDVADLDAKKTDRIDDLAGEIAGAVETANEVVEMILAGRIEHDPLTCVHHFDHAAVPDWTDLTGAETPRARFE